MSLFTGAVGTGLETAMDAVALRSRVVAHNLSNTMTPGYRAQRVDFESSLAEAMTTGRPGRASVTVGDASGAARSDGNTVDVEAEQIALIRAQLQYQALTQAEAGQIAVLRSAIARS